MMALPALLALGKTCLSGWRTVTFLLCPPSSSFVHVREEKSLMSLPLLVRTPVLLDGSLTLMASYNLIYPP